MSKVQHSEHIGTKVSYLPVDLCKSPVNLLSESLNPIVPPTLGVFHKCKVWIDQVKGTTYITINVIFQSKLIQVSNCIVHEGVEVDVSIEEFEIVDLGGLIAHGCHVRVSRGYVGYVLSRVCTQVVPNICGVRKCSINGVNTSKHYFLLSPRDGGGQGGLNRNERNICDLINRVCK